MHEEIFNRLNRQGSQPTPPRQQQQGYQSTQQQLNQQRYQHPMGRGPHQQQPQQARSTSYPQAAQQQNYGHQQQPQQQYAQQPIGQQRFPQQQRGGYQQPVAQGQQGGFQQRPQQWRPRPAQPPFNSGAYQSGRDFRQQGARENSQTGSAPFIAGSNQDIRRNPRVPNQPTQEQLLAMVTALAAQQQSSRHSSHYPSRRNDTRENRPPRQQREGGYQQREGGYQQVDRRQQQGNRGGRYQDNRQQQPNRRQRDTSGQQNWDQNRSRNVRPRSHQIQEDQQNDEQNEEEEAEQQENEEQQEGSENEEEEVDQELEEEQEQEEAEPEEENEQEPPPPPREQKPRQEYRPPTSVFTRPQKKLVYKPVSPVRHISTREQEESTGVEKCTKMCPDRQFQDRLKIFREVNSQDEPLRLDSESWFGSFQINRKTHMPDQSLTLKRFKRAATGSGEEEQSTIVRTPAALRQTMDHILRFIVDADNVRPESLPFIHPVERTGICFEDIYSFLWNRMRAMIKQISQLTPSQQRSESIITVSEQIARFFILSINQMRKYPDYDDQLNQKNLEKILAQLLQAYRDSKQELKRLLVELKKTGRTEMTVDDILREMNRRNIYISPFEPEISGYAMVFSSKENIDQHLGNMTDDLKELSENPILQSIHMKRALTMLNIINERSVASYFRGMDSNETGYLLACTMLFHLNTMRKEGIKRLTKTCKGGESDNESLSLSLVDEWMQFGDTTELIKFLRHIGARITMDETAIVLKQTLTGEDGLHYVTPYHQFPKQKLSRLSLGVEKSNKQLLKWEELSRQEIMRGLSIRHFDYDRRLVDLCRQSIWQSQVLEADPPEQEEPNLSIREQPSIEARRPERLSIPTSSAQTTEQKANILERIKKNKHQKFLDGVKGRLVNFFRASFERKKKQREKFNRLFHILSINMDRQQELGFYRIRAVSEYRKILQKCMASLKKSTELSKAFANDMKVPDEHQIFGGNLSGKPQQRSIRMMEGQDQSSEILPIQMDNETFEQKCSQQGFFGSVSQFYLEIPEERFAEQTDFDLRILIPIDLEYTRLKEVVKTLTVIVKYLTRLLGVEHFADFICNDSVMKATFSECIQFVSSVQRGYKQTRIHYTIDYFKYDNEEELLQRFDEEMYGANLLILPLNSADMHKAEELARAMANIDECLLQIPVVLAVFVSQPDQPLDGNFVAPFVKSISVVTQCLYSIGVDLTCKDAILDMLELSIATIPPIQPVRRFSLLRYLGEIKVNMKFLVPEIKRTGLRIFYYQEYLNFCFRCLHQASSDVFQRRFLLRNWPNEVRNMRKSCLFAQQTIDGKMSSVRDMTIKEQTFLDSIFSHLEMDLIQIDYYNPNNTKMDYFVTKLMSYMRPLLGCGKKRFEKYITKFNNLIRTCCFINHDQLPDGDLESLFSCVLNTIMESLHLTTTDCELLLPDSFLFRVSSQVQAGVMQQFEQEIFKKYSSLMRQLTKDKTSSATAKERIMQKLAMRREPPRQLLTLDSFVYCRKDMFDEYLRRVQNHQNETRETTKQPF